MVVELIAVAIYLLDQFTKYKVRDSFSEGESYSVIEGFFNISYIENKGAAFSSFEGEKLLLIVLPIIMIAACIFFCIKNRSKMPVFLRMALMLIISGGAGNITDRIIKGSVTDMFSFSIFPPVFNVADIAVVVGCAMMLIYVIFSSNEMVTDAENTEANDREDSADSKREKGRI